MKYFIHGCIFTDDEIEAECVEEAVMKVKNKYKNIHLTKIESGNISGTMCGYCQSCKKILISEFHTFYKDNTTILCAKCLKNKL